MANAIQEPTTAPSPDTQDWSTVAGELATWFGTNFSFVPADVDAEVFGPTPQWVGSDGLQELARTVARHSRPEFIAEEDPVVVLAMPIRGADRPCGTAIAPFVTRHVDGVDDVRAAAELMDMPAEEVFRWINGQPIWPADALVRLARAVSAKAHSDAACHELEREVEGVSDNLACTYEEISLLHTISNNLRISSTDQELGSLALEGLEEAVSAEGVAIYWLPGVDDADDSVAHDVRTEPELLTAGTFPLDVERFGALLEHLDLNAFASPLVANHPITGQADWPFDEVRQLIVVPLGSGGKGRVYGWLSAVNHANALEFGTIEARLLASVGAILGIHSSNLDLYRQQADYLTSVVRALTSAIDAKDPYTCGHSDRVARVAVCLAQEIGVSPEEVDLIYMGGLLHDVGKIGISDSVLRKPGRLSDAEFEHIKLHPGLGHKILADLKQLRDVLPSVLHHHEQWDGRGYPGKLKGEEIPLLARIVSVADAFDAMTSDRPYRKGMDPARVDEIFRRGAGTQWDADIIDAFFRVRDRMYAISHKEQDDAAVDVRMWT